MKMFNLRLVYAILQPFRKRFNVFSSFQIKKSRFIALVGLRKIPSHRREAKQPAGDGNSISNLINMNSIEWGVSRLDAMD